MLRRQLKTFGHGTPQSAYPDSPSQSVQPDLYPYLDPELISGPSERRPVRYQH